MKRCAASGVAPETREGAGVREPSSPGVSGLPYSATPEGPDVARDGAGVLGSCSTLRDREPGELAANDASEARGELSRCPCEGDVGRGGMCMGDGCRDATWALLAARDDLTSVIESLVGL
jgi:hypothetical protein